MDYFIPGADRKADLVASAKTTPGLHSENWYLFTDMGAFKGTFPLQVKEGTKTYQSPSRHMAYAIQEPLKRNKRLQEQQIIVLLGLMRQPNDAKPCHSTKTK